MGRARRTMTLEERGPAAALVLDDDLVAAVGEGAKAFPVRVTIGATTLRLRCARMRGESMVGFSKAARAEAGVEAGDAVEVLLELDDAPREVEVPAALATALAARPQAAAKFDALSFTHRKEFARWVAEAKRDDTRERRVEKALEMIEEGRTR